MTLEAKIVDIYSLPTFKLREEDEMECLAGGMTGDTAVRRSVAGSQMAFAQYIDGDLVCLWGWRWGNHECKLAVMWLLSCEGADLHKMAFGRASKKLLKVLQTQLLDIRILVHVHHKTAITWLEWLGFNWNKQYSSQFVEMKKEQV